MSIAINDYITEGLRFWSQKELVFRDNLKNAILQELSSKLLNINSAWTFNQMEGPILTPQTMVSKEYSDKEVFFTDWEKGGEKFLLRAETTSSSYVYAKYLLNNGAKMPLCVWQQGKSFRKESNDGASPAKMRYNEFNQLEFQCIYKNTTMANYRDLTINEMAAVVGKYTGKETRIVESDRLPSYSISTIDIEVLMSNNEWKEVASCSIRNDFSVDTFVLEYAFGLDRLVNFL